ncbi:MAG TPA: methyltransferase domain-containing protein [Tepidisphaeraceae bacterium]|nr:methyltransferase domain-containing protein [Tepidisphaeraceae bacterium]
MIKIWSQGVADENMSEDILTDLAAIVRRHPWWHARAKLMLALLRKHGVRPPAHVVDAGCGWGVNLTSLEASGYQLTGLDISSRCLQQLDSPSRDLILADLTQPLPDNAPKADAVIALDVIEHLDDDRGAVRNLMRLLKPGGVLIVSVPALPDLFSEFDSVQGHRRRYLPSTLRAACTHAGLEIRQLSWWGSWMVPLLRRRKGQTFAGAGSSAAEVYRKYLALPPFPGPLILRAGYGFEHNYALRGLTRTGTSLFCVCRRLVDAGQCSEHADEEAPAMCC